MGYKYNPPSSATPSTTRADILGEVRRWNDQAGSVIADVDLPTHYPATRPADQSAGITLRLRGVEVPIAVKRWGDFGTNFRCCYLVLRDLRLSEARGLEEAVKAAYNAMQIAAPKTQRDPWEVLGLRPGASVDEIEAMYRVKAKSVHPDSGGSTEAMAELNEARERAKQEAKV